MSMSFAAPFSYAAYGSRGKYFPSLSGITLKVIMADVSKNFSTSTFWRSATVLQPNASNNSFVQSIACSEDLVKTGLPLWAITFLKYLCEPSTKGSTATLPPPADSPKMVTLSGSPPKPAMFSCIHFKAIISSMIPKFCASG